MFAHFFIDRPIFATVISIFIVLTGSLAFLSLPLAQYPDIAPPTIFVMAQYPGADAQTVANTVAIPLEEAVLGLPPGKYPVMEALLSGGVSGLLEYAGKLGVVPEKEYTSKCAMCFYIRKRLSEQAPTPDLDAEHYTASLEYY